ncbi:ATP-binding protein [Streptomyces sp. NPDC005708]|uniref:ATP-binding protein n=1 Tax=Streptomyces sp. NPDC005708 TaxID=3154564 RepID=UPI00340F7FD1
MTQHPHGTDASARALPAERPGIHAHSGTDGRSQATPMSAPPRCEIVGTVADGARVALYTTSADSRMAAQTLTALRDFALRQGWSVELEAYDLAPVDVPAWRRTGWRTVERALAAGAAAGLIVPTEHEVARNPGEQEALRTWLLKVPAFAAYPDSSLQRAEPPAGSATSSIATLTRETGRPGPARRGHEISIRRDGASAPGGLCESESLWPGRCRRIVRAALRLWHQPDLVETAELLTSELVTNAFRHGTGPDVGVRLYLSVTHLVIEVRDGSPVRPALRQANPDDEDGRGLALVDALADAWGTSEDGTQTWCSLSLHEGPDEPMQLTAAHPVPVLRAYPAIALPGDQSAPLRARTVARTGITVIGWQGDVRTATDVVGALVDNAVAHGVSPDFTGEGITLCLSLTEDGQLLVEVTDPNPKFPNFESALQDPGGTLWRIQQHRAEITWFNPADFTGKTVRVAMTPGPVDL